MLLTNLYFMYNHAHDDINALSKFDDHKFYSYCATYKISPIIMYCVKPLVTVSMETKRCTKNICDCMTHHGTRPV